MKLVRKSKHLPNMLDSHSIVNIQIDKINKRVGFQVFSIYITKDGLANTFLSQMHNIYDHIEYIIDPKWDDTYNPPKPKNFDLSDPNTWNAISEDDFPRIINEEKLHASNVIKVCERGGDIEEAIIDKAIGLEILPISKEWFKLKQGDQQ